MKGRGIRAAVLVTALVTGFLAVALLTVDTSRPSAEVMAGEVQADVSVDAAVALPPVVAVGVLVATAALGMLLGMALIGERRTRSRARR